MSRPVSSTEKIPGGSHRMGCSTSELFTGGPCGGGRSTATAHHEHRPVRQVDDLVRGTAEYQPGELAAPAGPHHDDADVVLLGVPQDLARGMAVGGVPHLTMGG